MAQHAYANNDIEAHGSILLIPVALALPVIMGTIGKVDLFQRQLLFYVVMLAIGTALAIAYFLFESQSDQKLLLMDDEKVTFHDFGSHTLLWREIYAITLEEVETTKMKAGQPVKVERVVVRARRMDARDQTIEKFALQFNYGMMPAQLCAVLKEHWEASVRQTRQSGNDQPMRALNSGSAPTFGRRRTDFKRSTA